MSRSGSPGAMPAPYQEALSEATRAAWAHANEHVFNEKVRMKHAGKHREWEACSEEFVSVAKDVTDVKIATKICAVTQTTKREMNAEENEIRRITQIDVLQFKQLEEVQAQEAIANALENCSGGNSSRPTTCTRSRFSVGAAACIKAAGGGKCLRQIPE